MAKRRKNGVYPPERGLRISVLPDSTADALMAMPQFSQLGQHVFGADASSHEAATLLEVILTMLMEDVTEANAVVVRQAIAEAQQRYAVENQDLKDQLAAAQARAEAAEERARRIEKQNGQAVAALSRLSPPKDLLKGLHTAAKDCTIPTDQIQSLVGQARDLLENVKLEVSSILPGGE